MATFTNTFPSDSRYRLTLTVNQNSQNISANTSAISWSASITFSDNPAWGSWHSSQPWSAKINGVSNSGNWSYDFRNKATWQVASGNATIQHNADGTKSISVSFTARIAGKDTCTTSGTMRLATIPRSSSSTISPTRVELGNAVTINTNRASSSFTHKITATIGGYSKVIGDSIGASVTWTPPIEIANELTRSTSGTVTLKTETYNGTTKIGTSSTTLKVIVPASVKPSIVSITAADTEEDIAGQFGKFVQGKSRVRVVVKGKGSYGSSVSNTVTTFEGRTYNGASITTNSIQNYGNLILNVKVTDSRGRSTSSSKTITVLPYSAPSISNFDSYRVNTEGGRDDQGTSVKSSIHYNVALLDGKNTVSAQIHYRESGAKTWSLAWTNTTDLTFDQSVVHEFTAEKLKSYETRLTVTDWFGRNNSARFIVSISMSHVTQDWSATGVGFGKPHEVGAIDILAGENGGIAFDGIPSGLGRTISENKTITAWSDYADIPFGHTYMIRPGEFSPKQDIWYTFTKLGLRDSYDGWVGLWVKFDDPEEAYLGAVKKRDMVPIVEPIVIGSSKDIARPIEIPKERDLNDYTKSGYYQCKYDSWVATLDNCPTRHAFFMEVFENNGACQRITTYHRERFEMWLRNYYNGWGPWKKVVLE